MAMATRFSLLTFSLLVLLHSTSAAQSCYFPNQKATDSNWTPCISTNSNSACCRSGDLCLSNGYCFMQADSGAFANRLSRGACTDPSWQDPSCPKYCSDLSVGGGQTIALVEDETDGYFCCGFGNYFYNGTACQSPTLGSSAPFKLSGSMVIQNRTDGSTAPNITTSGSTATITDTPSTYPPPPSNGQVVAVGAGVGASLGTLFLAAMAFALMQSRRVRRLKQELARRNEFAQRPVALQAEKRGLLSPPHETRGPPAPVEMGDGPHPLSEMEGSSQPPQYK